MRKSRSDGALLAAMMVFESGSGAVCRDVDEGEYDEVKFDVLECGVRRLNDDRRWWRSSVGEKVELNQNRIFISKRTCKFIRKRLIRAAVYLGITKFLRLHFVNSYNLVNSDFLSQYLDGKGQSSPLLMRCLE